MKQTLTTTGRSAVLLLVFSLTAEAQPVVSAPAAIPCADPAAEIELALVTKSGPGVGRVRITGIVKNLGSVAWAATGPSHRLRIVLARRNSGAPPGGEPVQPAIAIQQMAPGQQYRIDYQTDWDTGKKDSRPGFLVSFIDSGQAGNGTVSSRADCRSDNNRKEITAADIDRLFQPAAPEKPLQVQGYRLLGGVGVNSVETQLNYARSSTNPGKLTASVAAPYTGTSDEVPINASKGTAKIRVHIPCDVKGASEPSPQSVTITYRLWGSLGLPGGSGWVTSFSIDQSIPYRALCGPDATGNTN